jgi:hypothetical protein
MQAGGVDATSGFMRDAFTGRRIERVAGTESRERPNQRGRTGGFQLRSDT